ncbi:MAG: DUF748 domain-containing protein [Pseudomonadota bacterium]
MSIAAAVLGGLVLLLVVGYHFALQRLHGAVLQALGPRASVETLDLRWNRVEIRGLRIRADREARPRWPAEDELRAERAQLVPDLRGLLRGQWRVGRVIVDKPYLSLYRSRDGKLHLLPALLDKPAPKQQAARERAAPPLVLIDRVQLNDAQVELFDASVRQPAHRLRLVALQADVQDLKLPALDEPITLAIEGVFKGPQRDGRLQIDGTLTPATHDAQLKARVNGVDLVALEPYLLKMAEGGVRRGTLDLKLDATVQNNRLKAPGTLTLSHLELKGAQFAGLPQRAVLAAMSRDERIEVQFTLAGRLDDPNFSLNEDFALRVTAALAEKLGVSVGGVVEGVGGVLKGLLGQ